MIEPYQRGKIPVVFIHGLLSDPITWLDAVNDLRAGPDILPTVSVLALSLSDGRRGVGVGGEAARATARGASELRSWRARRGDGRMVLVGTAWAA